MAVPWPDLTGGIGFDVLGHHWTREDHGKQEKLEASSMEGSEGATTARWRPQGAVRWLEACSSMA